MQFNLTEFTIVNLHGEDTYKIKSANNRLVIVAENGIGKTTVVNIIYYTLSRQWKKLIEYSFEKIFVTINDTSIILTRKEIIDNYRVGFGNPLRVSKFPPRYRTALLELRKALDFDTTLSSINLKIKEIAKNNGIETEFLRDYMHEIIHEKDLGQQKFPFEDFEEKARILREFGRAAQILYLPTYRRIEQDLTEIFPDLETNLEAFRRQRRVRDTGNKPFLELVEFGMEDVNEKIKQRLTELSNNLHNKLKNNLTGTYLKDIINQKYKSFNIDDFRKINLSDLNKILERIDKSTLSDTEKEYLRVFVSEQKGKSDISNDDKIVGHFIFSLMEIYDEQKREEEDINNFVTICNAYMPQKEFLYNKDTMEIGIFLKKNGRPILLKNLSSGEKQIVSLFSHLYLSKEKKYFVIIDEPELSLSVLWQQRLLPDIINSHLCAGLIAVTHSPFIFKNELKNSTHSLEEFKL